MAVNTTVLDSTISSVEGTPALAAANVPVSALSVDPSIAVVNTVAVDSTVPTNPQTTVVPQAVQSAYDVEGAGVVTLEQTDTSLSIISVDPGSGWIYNSKNVDTTRIEVEFTNGTQQVNFYAELLDGRVVTAVEATDTSVAPPRKDHENEPIDHESDESGDDD